MTTLNKVAFLDQNKKLVYYKESFETGTLLPINEEVNVKTELVNQELDSGFYVTVLRYDTNSDTYTYDISLNTTDYEVFEYTGDTDPIIGYVYDSDRNRFIPSSPVEGYIFDETIFDWKPDPSAQYDINGDGKLYTYNEETNAWYPVS